VFSAKKTFLYLLFHVLAKAFVEQCSQLQKSLSVLTAARISQSFCRAVFSAAKKAFLYLLLQKRVVKAFVEQCSQLQKSLSVLPASKKVL